MVYTLIRKRVKLIACLLLVNIIFSLVQPLSAWALTSGPSQPESQSFQPAGVSDMVDPFSGDFKYNIPLMDVDGYPLNLNYQSGVGMDDEASWVGLGWNLNVGSINRQLRGIPDDFAGDSVVTTHFTKPKITVGGRLTAKVEVKGKAKLGGSFSFGVFSDNYTGIGAEMGVNAGISFSLVNGGLLTGGLGIGILSNTSSGVDISPNASLSIYQNSSEKLMVNAGLSSSLGYNSRSGLKTLTAGKSFLNYSFPASVVSFNTEPISPKIQIPYTSTYGSFSFDVGGVAFGVFGGGGGTGYRSVREVTRNENVNFAYGFLYAERGKNIKAAVQDFIREKENPVIKELPNLALPVHTPDVFTYNSQAGSGQFRLYRGGTGAFSDNEVSDNSTVSTAGFDLGFGLYAHGGVTYFNQNTSNVTRKWTADNQYLPNGDFQNPSKSSPLSEHVFFRKVDEKNMEEQALTAKILGTSALAVNISGKTANSSFLSNSNYFTSNVTTLASPIAKQQRQVKRTNISYLTAKEAKHAALDKTIKTYGFIDSAGFNTFLQSEPVATNTQRNAGFRKDHHLSELTVTGDNSERMVYGIPVYNKKQEEYSFALGGNNSKEHSYSIVRGNLALLNSGAGEINYKKGIDHYFHKDVQSGYASSFLLTAILSPDYADKTGNGISPDDMGTAMKLNYSKIDTYRWRTPYAARIPGQTALNRTAAVNRGLLADPDDDKGSIVYGEKEIYYPHSIESKTQIAYFITADRLDGLGVLNWQGDRDVNTRQKLLKEIRLYSKADKSKPIKVVKFAYAYELCKGTPNSIGTGVNTEAVNGTENGKLTLKRVWFEYGKSPKGKEHPYIFSYDNKGLESAEVKYETMATDRWGTYKKASDNPGGLSNEEFPYTLQNKSTADANASLYHLTKIELPTGGVIDVGYEADDYAYVQNKRAAVMVPAEGIQGSANLAGATGINIHLDSVPPGSFTAGQRLEWFKNTYLSGSNYMFTKFYVEVGTDNRLSKGLNDDFISTYCKVNNVDVSGSTATVYFEPVNEAGVQQNPIRFAAWQKMKNEYPRYAYPGFLNRVGDGNSSVEAAIKAIITAAKNLTELKENFYVKANRKGYAKNVNLAKSFVRISKITGAKIGGGVRVKKIRITDSWQGFTGDATAQQGIYGQSYQYTTTEKGRTISSGVASYEPSIGNDENPLKQPVPYVQKIKGAINNYFELEEPFGESFFPAPSVGYSKVTVKDLKADGTEDPAPQTGTIVNEFYTAKEFPVLVQFLPMQKYNPSPDKTYSLVKTNSIEEMVLSQGYRIELNDMHGKPRAVRVLNQGGAEISSTVYEYGVEDPKAEVLKLNNKVNVIKPDGTVLNDVYIGRDIELFTDLREQESKNSGQAINIGLDVTPFFFGIPLPIPHWPINGNNEYKLFRSACAVKVIQNYGIVSKVIKKENGSSIAVENVAYDGVTGDALVTRTQNEFDNSYYSVNLPAYWVYKGMGPAYQNLGVLLQDLVTNASGAISNSVYSNLMMPGDELVDIATGTHYWVIETAGSKRLIDKDGAVQQVSVAVAKIIRSGYRNMLQPATSTLVCQNNPVQGTEFKLATGGDLSSLRVISASASLFDEKWGSDATVLMGAQPVIVEDQTHDWFLREGVSVVDTNVYAYVDTEAVTVTVNLMQNLDRNIPGSFFRAPGRLWASSIYPAQLSFNNQYKLTTSFTVNESKTYYVGAGRNGDPFNYIFDCYEDGIQFNTTSNVWLVIPIYFTAGMHTVTMGMTYDATKENAMGLEIYDNTLEEIRNPGSGEHINIIYSTAQLRGTVPLQSYIQNTGFPQLHHYTYPNGTPMDVCPQAAVTMPNVNPYLTGFLGNWRPYQTKVYQDGRKYKDAFTAGVNGMELKTAGTYATFRPFFSYHTNQWGANSVLNWITANTVTLYDKYGQELENKDALGRYSAAIFNFNGEMPAAVASNAMNREAFADSFEDTKFKFQTNLDTGGVKLISSTAGQRLDALVTNAQAHTGNYSLSVNTTGVELNTRLHSLQHKTNDYLSTGTGGYKLIPTPGLYPNGFSPKTIKKYIISTWVKDGQPLNKSINITITAKGSGSYLNIPLSCKAVVEGWKLLEGEINTSAIEGDWLKVNIKANSGTIYIDDVRIHPFNAHLKSYAYSDKNFKLMAELDENAFATFYEYDDGGSLIRVKKETERGIITIKENRSSNRKKQ